MRSEDFEPRAESRAGVTPSTVKKRSVTRRARTCSGSPRPVSVIYPHARLMPVRTRAFVDWMKQEFSGFAL